MSLAASITPAWRGGVKHAGVAWWRGQARRSLVRGTRGNVAKHAAYVVKHAAYVVKQAGVAWWRGTRGIRGDVGQAGVAWWEWCAPGGGSDEAAMSGRAPVRGFCLPASGAEPPLKPPPPGKTGGELPALHGCRVAPASAQLAAARGGGCLPASAAELLLRPPPLGKTGGELPAWHGCRVAPAFAQLAAAGGFTAVDAREAAGASATGVRDAGNGSASGVGAGVWCRGADP